VFFVQHILDIYSMCGIAGIVTLNTELVSAALLKKMTDAIAHRGPDGEGQWLNQSRNIGLGHRRLSIIDLSPAGAQPMHYLGRYSIVHNGEIYNYIELKKILQEKGYSFISQTDTEVILAAYDCWKSACLQQFDGMFAFAIWDEQEKILFAARDRFGEKPFYYYHDGQQFIFASEMKALWTAGVDRIVNEKLLLNYLALGHTQNPGAIEETFFKHINKLPPANHLTIELDAMKKKVSGYWTIDKLRQDEWKEDKAIEKFHELFTHSVAMRLRSDVPVGTSLSGGLDSSSIAATIKIVQPNILFKTFSAVFPGFEKDESRYIKIVHDKLQLDNYQSSPGDEDFINDVEKLLYHQEEPVGSASIYAQYKVFELAKQHNVTVLLDGQGADEILAGYHKYYHWFWQELYRTNQSLLKQEVHAARQAGIRDQWNWKNKLATWFPEQAARALQKREITKIKHDSFINDDFLLTNYSSRSIHKPIVHSLNDMLYFNTCQFGLEELLRYADRNSMAQGREVRLPFLSHHLVEFIFSLQAHYKIHNGWTKWILRKTMESRLPNEIAWRKDKTGFEPPQKQWMQNKQVQDYVHEAKTKLANQRILKDTVLSKKNQPQDAYAADNYDWRYLVAATLL
jgi:asparagine synthase (glutamine-hydrolysing)